jgi:hypothetical protein
MTYMRRSIVSAVAVAGSLTLGAGVLATSSEAKTAKELNICWVNQTPNPILDLEVVADGPSYKTTTLDNGDCMAWDVRAGQYQFTVEDVQEFLTGIDVACPGDLSHSFFKVTIKRMKESYKAFNPTAFANGSITTNVRKDRRTSVTAYLACI